MIVTFVFGAAVLVFVGSFAWDRLRRRRRRALAERGRIEGGRADGVDTSIAAEGLLRGGYPPDSGGGGFN